MIYILAYFIFALVGYGNMTTLPLKCTEEYKMAIGKSLKTVSSQSRESCDLECRNTPLCIGANFFFNYSKCQLFNEINNKVINEEVDLIINNCDKSSTTTTVTKKCFISGYRFNGDLISTVNVETKEGCLGQCKLEPGCIAANFDTEKLKCEMVNKIGYVTEETNIVGIKGQCFKN